jgi:hypothetical protein
MHATPVRYGIGGKTGTAEFRGEEDYGWFVGYAPLDDPRIVVALIVEEGQHGSTVAPIAKAIIETYLDEVGAPRLNELAATPGTGQASGLRAGPPLSPVTPAARPAAVSVGGVR